MYLSKLEIQGFKSFAEKATLEFNHDLTAVVGPNGSGKSNVADAVRWGLGEQSLKLLRGKKSEDVIFAGSKKRPRLGFAEVSLYLNNEDGSAPIDYREVVITRRIYRDGENEYLINKNKVRLSDVQLLLAKSNFGQRNYAIIGQGMIDSILVSSPSERKEFFDEATGVLQYQLKKDQAANKLEHSQENLGQSQRLILEIEPRLRSLSRQVKRLERREEVVKDLQVLQNNYYSFLTNDLNQQQKDLHNKLAKLETEKQELQARLKASQSELEKLQNQDTQADAFRKLQDKYADWTQQKNKLLQELTLIKGKIDLDLTKQGKIDIIWLAKQKTEVSNRLSQLAKQLKDNQLAVEKLTRLEEIKSAEQKTVLIDYQKIQAELLKVQKSLSQEDSFSLAKVQTHLDSLYQKYQQFLQSIDDLKDLSGLVGLKRQAKIIDQEINYLIEKLKQNQKQDVQELVKVQKQMDQFLVTKDSLVNEIHELRVNLEVTKQKNQQLESEQQKLTEELKKLELEINSADQKKDQGAFNLQLNQQKTELESQISDIDRQLKVCQEQLDSFSKNQGEVREKLLSLQRNQHDLQSRLNLLSNDENEIKVDLAKIETRKEDLEKEIMAELGANFKLNPKELQLQLLETQSEINRLKNQLAVIGGIDQEVVKEHKEVKERYEFLSEQSTDLEKAINSCQEIIEDLEEKIKKQFESAFEKINEYFSSYFRILFNGGQSKLILQKKEIIEEELPAASDQEASLVDEVEAPIKKKKKKYEIGIEIQATPPGKKLSSLNMLSGGEKALTSIALISAIIANNPSPFVVLDEVEAALDEANSERFAKIVDELSDRTQFICISHNRVTMQKAAILYGVTMGDDGVSKLLSLNLAEAERVAQ
jgi:chromosome segregation protein